MNEVHIVMQGKGGVGKSFVAFNLAQYLRSKNSETLCIDTDPLTPTLKRFGALNPMHIQIADQSSVDLQKFDEMIERIIGSENDVIIDTGSSTFLPISNYMISSDIFEILCDEYRRRVIVHVVLNAQTQNDFHSTTTCLLGIARSFPDKVELVIWLNEYGGEIRGFEESKLYYSVKDRVAALIRIKDPDELAVKDIAAMLGGCLTYDEAISSSNFRVVSKARLKKIRKSIFDQLVAPIPNANYLAGETPC